MVKALASASPDQELSQGRKVAIQRVFLKNHGRQVKNPLLPRAHDCNLRDNKRLPKPERKICGETVFEEL